MIGSFEAVCHGNSPGEGHADITGNKKDLLNLDSQMETPDTPFCSEVRSDEPDLGGPWVCVGLARTGMVPGLNRT